MSFTLNLGYNVGPKTLIASPGSFFAQGAPAGLAAPPGNLILPASTGGFSVAGQAATLTQGGGSPAFFQNFDGLVVGSTSGLDNWGSCQVDNSQSFSSPNSYKCHCVSGSGAAGASKVMANGTSQSTQGDEVWFRARALFPAGFNFTATGGGGDALKFMRIDTGSVAANGHGAHIDWYLRGGTATNAGTFDFILEGIGSWFYGSGPTPIASGIVRGSWYTIEVYYKLHSVASSAIIRMWVNGTLIVDTSANLPTGVPQRATLNNATDFIASAQNASAAGYMFITYWNVQSPATQDFWLDDYTVYASNINGRPNAVDAAGNAYIGMS